MKNLLRFGLAILIFTCLGGMTLLSAQTGSMDDAARNFWIRNNLVVRGDRNVQFDRVTARGELVVYEKFSPASFIILMELMGGYTILGYSFNNLFFGNPSGLAKQPELLDALATAGRMDIGKVKGTRSLTQGVGPLLQSQWGQGQFFNYYCPRDSRGPSGHVYAGCVAIAMGQIIRYFGSFNTMNFHYDYDSGRYGDLSAQIGPYDWNAMESAPISVNLEVSDFLYDLGVLLNMNYGASASTTNSHRTLEAFHQLGYINGVIMRKSKFTAESWTEIFYQNLSEYKPVLVTGGGHAFVCDGYNMEGLFHFNLGWDGYGDGFYPLSGVMNFPVSEAFTELEPISWPKPPQNISFQSINQKNVVNWVYEADRKPLSSRVYVDEKLYLDTPDTLFVTSQLSPGLHNLHVSAVYADGESRWIGPVEVFIQGEPLVMNDPLLYSVIRKSLGFGISDSVEQPVYVGDLSRITSLDIDQPILSMEGLGFCNHLKRLVLEGFPGPALDAGPLESLSQLKILEWNGRVMIHPEILAKLTRLSELFLRQTPLESLDFLKGYGSLLKFEYSGATIGNCSIIPELDLLEELTLRYASLSDAGFVALMPQLVSLDLSGNNLSETSFLSTLVNLDRANLADNRIVNLLLTDQLQSLHELNVSNNSISRITITAELNLLHNLNLSGNKLITPGRLLLYTPALAELDLSNNQLRDMGKQRCQNLTVLDVSNNQLITVDWTSLQPSLKRVEMGHNRISDISGLTKNKLFRNLDFLGLDNNPLSKQSFLESLPILVEAIDTVCRPLGFQPLSPCYVSPVDGSRVIGSSLEFQWVTDNSNQKCVYDLFNVSGDSLIPIVQGLEKCSVTLNQRPSAAFSWVVASRTSDSIYYSGVYDVIPTANWALPFKEDFETYRQEVPFSDQSDYWFKADNNTTSSQSARVVAGNSRSGSFCLKLPQQETVILSAQHLKVPYLSAKFSVLIPPGQSGVVRVQNLNGMYFKLVWDASDVGKFFINDKFYSTFTIDHLKWTDYEIMAHARNNSILFKAGTQILINKPWKVPEGEICMESIEFSSSMEGAGSQSGNNTMYIDDVKITSESATSTDIAGELSKGQISVYPNPCVDFVNISFSEAGRYELSMLDFSGKEVYRQLIEATMNSVNTISLLGLTPGVYTLRTDVLNFKPMTVIKI